MIFHVEFFSLFSVWQAKLDGTKLTETLTFVSVQKADGGNYTCSLENVGSSSVTLHVLSGTSRYPPKFTNNPVFMQTKFSCCQFLFQYFFQVKIQQPCITGEASQQQQIPTQLVSITFIIITSITSFAAGM